MLILWDAALTKVILTHLLPKDKKKKNRRRGRKKSPWEVRLLQPQVPQGETQTKIFLVSFGLQKSASHRPEVVLSAASLGRPGEKLEHYSKSNALE